MKACVVLDMFKTFIRSAESVFQLLKNEVLYYNNTHVWFGIARRSALQCLNIVLVFRAGLLVSS